MPDTAPLLRDEKIFYLPLDLNVPVDPKMQAVTQKYLDKFNEKGKVVVGKTAVTLRCDNNEGIDRLIPILIIASPV